MARHREPTDTALDDVPDWTSAGDVYDWRDHVGERTRAIWATLSIEQRTAIAQDAAEAASDAREAFHDAELE